MSNQVFTREWKPKESLYWLSHLEHLLENKPQEAWKMFRSNQLERYLDKKADQASSQEARMNQKGMPHDQVRELVLNDLNPPEEMRDEETPKLSEKKEDQIRKWAERKIEQSSEN